MFERKLNFYINTKVENSGKPKKLKVLKTMTFLRRKKTNFFIFIIIK